MKGQQMGTPQLPFVVIAQLSALPHYRVAFYRELSRVSAGKWDFGVVFDPEQAISSDYKEELESSQLGFCTLPVRSRTFKVFGQKITWQGFSPYLRRASLLVTDSHLLNISYPWFSLTRPKTCKWVVWGHTTNRNLDADTALSFRAKLARAIKRHYLNRARAVFTYTPGEAERLTSRGKAPETFIIPNTIDLEQQRRIAIELLPRRKSIRERLGYASDQRVFITVGRLLPGRRVDFLFEAFRHHVKSHPNDRLVIIGGGEIDRLIPQPPPAWLTMPGPLTDPYKTGEFLAAADAYIAPGMIGLGILPPLINELPLLAFDLPTHGPEVEYLNESNSVLLPGQYSPTDFAHYLSQWNVPHRKDYSRYESISHLTLANMASKFDAAVCKILGIP